MQQIKILLLFFNFSWEHVIYQFGCEKSTIAYVIKKGEVVHAKKWF